VKALLILNALFAVLNFVAYIGGSHDPMNLIIGIINSIVACWLLCLLLRRTP
jgi:hypothetical protein